MCHNKFHNICTSLRKDIKILPWYNNHTCTLKQTTQKLQMEKNSKGFQHQAKLVAFQIVWKEPPFNNKNAHTVARTSCVQLNEKQLKIIVDYYLIQ